MLFNKIILCLFSLFVFTVANKCITTKVEDDTIQSASNRKMKWAIVALTKQGPYQTKARDDSIVKFISPYIDLYDITIIYFSEVDFTNDVHIWQSYYQKTAKVLYINTSKHRYYTKDVKYGYKYMCKFFALDIYSYLKQYDYYLRCDTDCKIKSPTYDLFHYVHQNRIEYGYALRKLEAHKITRETLTPFVLEYLEKCTLKATSPMDYPLTTCFNFYNNFHIGKVSFFLRPDVQHFLQAVNDTGRILSDRWGDSTIQAYAVRMFMNPHRVQLIPNFTYVHGSHNGFITTFNEGRKSNIPQSLPHWKYTESK